MEPLGPDVRRELKRFGAASELGDVVSRWPAAVGEAIARNAWPARFTRDGTLVVHTSDSVWAFELAQRADEIRERLAGLVPKAVKFVPGLLPAEGREGTDEVSRKGPVATDEDIQMGSSIAASVENDELRELVARAVTASLARRRSDRSFW
jgi:Dna[CI] antecedent, DciA